MEASGSVNEVYGEDEPRNEVEEKIGGDDEEGNQVHLLELHPTQLYVGGVLERSSRGLNFLYDHGVRCDGQNEKRKSDGNQNVQ